MGRQPLREAQGVRAGAQSRTQRISAQGSAVTPPIETPASAAVESVWRQVTDARKTAESTYLSRVLPQFAKQNAIECSATFFARPDVAPQLLVGATRGNNTPCKTRTRKPRMTRTRSEQGSSRFPDSNGNHLVLRTQVVHDCEVQRSDVNSGSAATAARTASVKQDKRKGKWTHFPTLRHGFRSNVHESR